MVYCRVINPGLQITDRDYDTIGEATAWIENPYSVPTEVIDECKVLVGTPGTFSPNNYEVLYLSLTSVLEKKKEKKGKIRKPKKIRIKFL